MILFLLIQAIHSVDPVPTTSAVPSTAMPPPSTTMPPPTSTPRATLEVMPPLQSNNESVNLSVFSIFCITVMGTIVVLYVILYLIPFVREDFAPLLEFIHMRFVF